VDLLQHQPGDRATTKQRDTHGFFHSSMIAC
jgi:hypothetical protein